MLECLIIGDSIAFGLSKMRPDCAVTATVGITSTNWVDRNLSSMKNYATTIISLGTNDWDKATAENLLKIRKKINGRVFWVLPSAQLHPQANQIVRELANEYKDSLVETKHLYSDKIHPTGRGYKDLAEKTKKD
jgi:lysophospholipase L1-like esterase